MSQRPAPIVATVITTDNIYTLVEAYMNDRARLPADLRGIPIGDWNVSNVTNMAYLFDYYNINEPLNNWNVSNVTNMAHMFHYARQFNQPLDRWNVSNVTNMAGMFEGAIQFNQPLDRWNVSNVTNMNRMFKGARSFSQNPNWNIGQNVITTNMFEDTLIYEQPSPPPQIALPPPPQRAPAPPPQEEPGGVAFEIHNAFGLIKLNEFIDLIKSETNFMNEKKPLQPLIDNINANPANSAKVKRDLTAKINKIFTTLKEYGQYNENINKITFCIQYVLMQPQEFIDAYIQTLISDCLNAYSTGRQESCVRGVYERIFYSFRDTIATICLDQMHKTGDSPLCKPEYITLFNFFYKTWPKTEPGGLNEMFGEWYGDGAAVSALSPENRIESFVSFVRSKINNKAMFEAAEASIRRYASVDIPGTGLFGGRKRNKRSVKKRSNKKRFTKSIKTYS